jgi:hypothetical protein
MVDTSAHLEQAESNEIDSDTPRLSPLVPRVRAGGVLKMFLSWSYHPPACVRRLGWLV